MSIFPNGSSLSLRLTALVPVLDEAWLLSALLAAEPVSWDVIVDEPTVVTPVAPSEPVVVETIGAVVSVTGAEVAPTMPPIPERVLTPVDVIVELPLVTTVVKPEVVMAEGEPVSAPLPEPPEDEPPLPPSPPAPPPKMVVDPTVEVRVEPSVVITVTIAEVVIALDEPPEPEPEPDPEEPYSPR